MICSIEANLSGTGQHGSPTQADYKWWHAWLEQAYRLLIAYVDGLLLMMRPEIQLKLLPARSD